MSCTVDVYFYDRPDRRYDCAEGVDRDDDFITVEFNDGGFAAFPVKEVKEITVHPVEDQP